MHQNKKRTLAFCLVICLSTLLAGCGGYARTSDSSGVQVYGTIDGGVAHTSR